MGHSIKYNSKEKGITIDDIKGVGSNKFGNYENSSIEYTGRKAIYEFPNILPFGERETNANNNE